MRAVGVGAVLFLSMSLGVAGAKDKEEAPTKVVLGFGWPQALGADVTYRWTRTSTGKPAQGETIVGKMNVATEGEGLRVEYRDWHAAAPAAATAPDAPPNYLHNASPVVDKKGTVVRVDGPAPGLFKAAAAHNWQMLVSSWAGAELELGKEYEVTNEAPSPSSPAAS